MNSRQYSSTRLLPPVRNAPLKYPAACETASKVNALPSSNTVRTSGNGVNAATANAASAGAKYANRNSELLRRSEWDLGIGRDTWYVERSIAISRRGGGLDAASAPTRGGRSKSGDQRISGAQIWATAARAGSRGWAMAVESSAEADAR